jgi:epoxide hydrolase-like predicted phosphatase
MIKAGIFDIGGVLCNDPSEDIQNDVRTTLQIDPAVFEEAWSQTMNLLGKGKITEAEFWQRFLAAANVHVPLPAESLLLRAFIKTYQQHEETIEVVQAVRKQGYTVAALSNTIQPHAEFLTKRGLYQRFDVVVLSHEVGLEKPNPEIFHYTLKQVGVTAAEAFFVDDREKNTTAAQDIGIHSILYRDAATLRAELKQSGVRI